MTELTVTKGEGCSYNQVTDAAYSLHLTRNIQCLFGRGRTTRGYIKSECLLDPKATQPGRQYNGGECKGSAKIFQPEAVAQARAIAKFNQMSTYQALNTSATPLPGISPNIQWETDIPGGRPDILLWDRTGTSDIVSLVEVKGDWNGGATAATTQLGDYIDANQDGLDGYTLVQADVSTFSDTFSIRNCGKDARNPGIRYYATGPVPADPGVLLVRETSRTNCGDDDDQTGQGSASQHGHAGVDVTIGIDQDGNGNDDFWDIIRSIVADHGWLQYLAVIPDDASIPFRTPIYLHLTAHMVLHIVEGLAAASSAARPNAIGTRILKAFSDAQEASGPDLAADTSASDSELQMLEAMWQMPDLGGSGNLQEYVSETESGLTPSDSTIAGASSDFAGEIAPISGETAGQLTEQIGSTLTLVRDGAGLEEAAASSGMTDVAENTVVAFVGAETVGDVTVSSAAVLLSAALTVAAVLIIAAVVAVAVIWAANHWNLIGDPHIVTLDGLAYDMQSVGEFHLVRIPGTDVDIQGRYTALSSEVSGLDEIAMTINESLVEIHSNGSAFVNGDPIPEDSHFVDLGDGAGIWRQGSELVVRYPGPDAVTVSYGGLSFAVDVPVGVATEGILGNHNGSPDDDLRLADGTTLTSNSASEIDGQFADSWRINDDDSDFSYADGQSTATFTDTSFPAHVTTLGDFDTADLNAAAQTCNSQGVAPGPQFDDCLLDVVETGDSNYAAAASAVTDYIQNPDAIAVDAGGSLSESYDDAIPVNLRPISTWNPLGTSIEVGPVFDGNGYEFSVPNMPSHIDAAVSFDLDVFGLTAANNDGAAVKVNIDSMTPAQITFDSTNATVQSGPATVTQSGTGSTPDGTPYESYRITISGDDLASQMRFSIAPTGFRGVLGTSLAIDNLAIIADVIAPQTYTIGVGDVVSPNQPGAGAGRLETKASQDIYSVHLGASQADEYLDFADCPPGLQWSLRTNTGSTVEQGDCGGAEFRDLASGDYTLDIAATASTPAPATYQLSLQPIPADVSAGIMSVDGSSRTITTSHAGQNGSLTFTGSAGERIQLAASGATVAANWNLISPNGSSLYYRDYHYGADTLLDTTTLPQSGTYTILFDPVGDRVGSATFQSTSVPDDVDAGILTVDGPPLTVSTAAGGQNASLTFAGIAGERVLLQASGSTVDATWDVEQPDGNYLYYQDYHYGTDALVDTTTLPQTGTYTIQFDPVGAQAGGATFQATTVPTDIDAGALSVNSSPLTVTTVAAGQNASLTFAGTAGERIQIRASNSTMTASWNVIQPDGGSLYYRDYHYGTNALVDTTTLPQTGTYTILIDPVGVQTGSVDLQAWSLPDGDVDGGVVQVDGPTTQVTVSNPGQNALLTFQGTAGHRIQLRASDATMTATWQIIEPNGANLFYRDYHYGANALVDTTTLPQTGTYRIAVDPVDTQTGSLTFGIWSVPGDTDGGAAVTDGTPSTLSISAPGQNGSLTFHGDSGQRIQLQASDASMTVTWFVLQPDGSTLYYQDYHYGANAVLDPMTLSQTGTYTIMVDPVDTQTGSIRFGISTILPDVADTMTIDGPTVAVSTVQSGQNATLSFDGTAGQYIHLQASGATENATWYVLSPTNGYVEYQDYHYGANASFDITLPASGTYTIVIDPQGTQYGSINFHAWTNS